PWRSSPWLHQRIGHQAAENAYKHHVSMAIIAVAASKGSGCGRKTQSFLGVHGDHRRGCIKGSHRHNPLQVGRVGVSMRMIAVAASKECLLVDRCVLMLRVSMAMIAVAA